jgi:hypothetical protein
MRSCLLKRYVVSIVSQMIKGAPPMLLVETQLLEQADHGE